MNDLQKRPGISASQLKWLALAREGLIHLMAGERAASNGAFQSALNLGIPYLYQERARREASTCRDGRMLSMRPS